MRQCEGRKTMLNRGVRQCHIVVRQCEGRKTMLNRDMRQCQGRKTMLNKCATMLGFKDNVK